MSTMFCNTVRASCMSSRTGFKWEISTSLTTVRDTFPFPSLVQHRTVFPTQPVGTSPSNTVRASNRHRSLSTVRDTFLGPSTPYGISNRHISRTVVYKPPYGTSCAYTVRDFTSDDGFPHPWKPYGFVFPTVRDHSFWSCTCVSNDTSEKYRSGLQQTPYGIYVPGFPIIFLEISRPYLNTKSSWPSSTRHWSLFAFRRTSPHWLFPHQYRHTPYGISTQIFTTVRYFCSCFFHTVRAKKTLKTNFLHKEQTSFPLEKNSIY